MSNLRRRLHTGESSSQGALQRVRQNQGENIAQVPDFLDFSTITPLTAKLKFETKYETLRHKKIMSGGAIDWNVFKNEGEGPSIYDELATYLDVDYVENGDFQFQTRVWRDLFSINEPLYEELILEFFSTYSFRQSHTYLSDVTAIKFRLGGVFRQLSMIEFAAILGLYPPEITNHEQFEAYLRSARMNASDRVLHAFWSRIGQGNYNPRGCSTMHIRDPLLQIFHKLFIKTINSRQEVKDKVSRNDLFLLYCIANRFHVNIPLWIARHLTEIARNKPIPSITGGGQFVTRIARHFGLLTEANLRVLTLLDPMEILGRGYWIQKGVCKETLDGSQSLQLASRYNWVVGTECLAQSSESMEHVATVGEQFGQEEPIMTESMEQLFTNLEAESRGKGPATEEHEIPYPSLDMNQRMAHLETMMSELTLQVNEYAGKQNEAGWEQVITNSWITDFEQKLGLLGLQMEWLHRRYEHVYPPINYPFDPWPTAYYPPPPPPPQQ